MASNQAPSSRVKTWRTEEYLHPQDVPDLSRDFLQLQGQTEKWILLRVKLHAWADKTLLRDIP